MTTEQSPAEVKAAAYIALRDQAPAYLEIANHFQAIAGIMARVGSYHGAASAQDASEAFKRVSQLITDGCAQHEVVRESIKTTAEYFSEH